LKQFFWRLPLFEIFERVGTYQKEPSCIGLVALKLLDGIDRVADTTSLDLDRIDFKIGMGTDSKLEHLQSMLVSRWGVVKFKRGNFRRNELHCIQRKFAAKLLCHQQMPEVNWVKRTTEDADSF